jgi:hypothetical protein
LIPTAAIATTRQALDTSVVVLTTGSGIAAVEASSMRIKKAIRNQGSKAGRVAAAGVSLVAICQRDQQDHG